MRWTEVRHSVGAGLLDRINHWTSRLRIEARVDVLPDEWLPVDEIDLVFGALEKPEITASADIDQPLDCPAASTVVDENRRRYFVPVPRLVWIVLLMPDDFSIRDVQGDGRAQSAGAA